MTKAWSIEGAEGEPILGDTHVPEGAPRGVVVIAHGFKGYKDYGMFPRIAETMAAAGMIAHRFNFSHSGMTNRIETFERPDLFERDTFNKQVFDCRAVIGAIAAGRIDGTRLPCVLFGHSRGGAAALLTVGRSADDPLPVAPVGVVAASAPSACNPLPPEQADQLLERGFLESPSARTGQALRIGRASLSEQLEDPPAHDLPALVRRIDCPLLLVHGEADPTVPVACAHQLAEAAGVRAEVLIVEGADHVFNTPNPLPADEAASPQLQHLLRALVDFALTCCRRVTK